MTPSDVSAAITTNAWEDAYLRFETPAQEARKFRWRLERLGAKEWPRDSRIVELFCGRGNGLVALQSLGFSHIEGIDLSLALVSRYNGPGTVVVGDCRSLPYSDSSRDVLIVQGGLHHLPDAPGDVDRVVQDVERVLRVGGRFVVVEPWDTPFLRLVHMVSSMRLARAVSQRLDAFATMVEYERVTYDRWLSMPHVIERTLTDRFDVDQRMTGWGKFMFVGRKRG